MIYFLDDIGFYLLQDRSIQYDFYIKVISKKDCSRYFTVKYSLELFRDIELGRYGIMQQLINCKINPY